MSQCRIYIHKISTVSYMGLTTPQIISLIGGALTMMVQGSLYVFGTIIPYLASYLYYHGQQDITINELQIIITIAVLSQNAGMLLPKIKFFYFNHFVTSFISITGISASIFIISFHDTFQMFFLFYGIVFGLFIGYGYVAPVKNCYEHIPDKKGLCTGVCIMGFGIGAFFFNIILLNLINPENHHVDEDHRFPQQIADNLPFALKIISAVYFVIGSIGSALIRPIKKEEKKLNPLIQQEQKQENAQQNLQLKSSSKLQAFIKKKQFLLTLTIACSIPYGNFVTFYYKQYGLTQINNDQVLTIIGSVGSIFNGFSRLYFGSLMDIISYKSLATLLNIILLINCCVIYFAVQNQYLYMLVVLLSYSCYGGNFGIYPTQTIRVLGQKTGTLNYWLTFLGFSIAAIIQFLCHYFLVNELGQEGFKYCFIIFGVLICIALFIVQFFKFQYDEDQKKFIQNRDLKKKAISSQYSDQISQQVSSKNQSNYTESKGK